MGGSAAFSHNLSNLATTGEYSTRWDPAVSKEDVGDFGQGWPGLSWSRWYRAMLRGRMNLEESVRTCPTPWA